MWCVCVVYLYIGVRPSNWIGRVECEMNGLEQIRKALMEASQQGSQFTADSRPCRMYSRGASRRRPFKNVQIYYCEIMPIKTIVVKSSRRYLCLVIPIHAILQYWLMFIFRRLKINYDSNEFILEIGTVANTKAVAHTNPVAELEYTYVERPRKRQRWSTWKISMKCRILL
jgi:hypothetical protein